MKQLSEHDRCPTADYRCKNRCHIFDFNIFFGGGVSLPYSMNACTWPSVKMCFVRYFVANRPSHLSSAIGSRKTRNVHSVTFVSSIKYFEQVNIIIFLLPSLFLCLVRAFPLIVETSFMTDDLCTRCGTCSG